MRYPPWPQISATPPRTLRLALCSQARLTHNGATTVERRVRQLRADDDFRGTLTTRMVALGSGQTREADLVPLSSGNVTT